MEIVEDDGVWIASIPDLPGCNSYGDSVSEAISNIQQAKDLWIQGRYETDSPIPEPTNEEDFSGKFILRIPRTLHRCLFYEAKKQGVSLNHYASHLLSVRQSIYAFASFAQNILDSCPNEWRTQWNESDHTIAAGKLSGTEYLLYMKKPPKEGHYKTEQIPASTRRLYIGR
jgi:predicted RNase H-like HicB family nuclease